MATLQTAGMTLREKQIVGYVFLAHGVNHILDLTYAAVLGVVAVEFGASLVTLGLFATLSALAFGITGMPAGFLADRIGSKRTLVICLYASAGTSAFVAVSSSLWFLGVALTLMGLAGGLYHPAGIALVARGVRQRAKAMGYHGVAGNLGVVLAPPLATAMVGIWDWRAAFLLVAVICGVAAVIIQRGRLEGEEAARIIDSQQLDAGRPGTAWDRRRYLMPLAAILAINLLGGFAYRATLTYLPLHLQRNLGIHLLGLTPEVMGGMVSGVALLFGAVGQLIGGHLGERYRREALLLPLAVLMVPALWGMGLTGGMLLIGAASVFAFFNFAAQPSYTALVADYTPPQAQGRVYGLMFTLGMGVGSLGGVFGGWIAEEFGVAWVFPAVGGVSVGIVALTGYLLLAATSRARRSAQGPR